MKKNASLLTPYILGEKKIDHSEDKIQEINRLLIEIERDFLDLEGIPNRNWFKHLIFGCRYTYAVLLLPALTEAAEAGDEEGVMQALQALEGAIKKANAKLTEAATLLDSTNKD